LRNDDVMPVPEEALQSIDSQIEEAGGEWQEPVEDAGAVGRTMFDLPASADGTVTVLLPSDQIEPVPRQSLVRIHSADQRSYLGAVVKGPFAEPDGLRADAPILVSVTVRGGLLLPRYHGRAQVELLGEELDDGAVLTPRRRPLPNSPVFALSGEETARVLHADGDVRVGLLDGHEDVEVRFPSASKSVLSRHLGILGTTGGGKSTTVSGLVDQLQQAGVACVILDTEGEYTAIDQPGDDASMLRALERRGLQPHGVDNTAVYHLVGREPANPNHQRMRAFSLRFADISPHALVEILELNDAQQTRFWAAYDVTKQALERFGIYPRNEADRQRLLELDELETGYPEMTLAHLHEMVSIIAAWITSSDILDGDLRAALPYVRTEAFIGRARELAQILGRADLPKHVPSWRVLQGRLGRIKRLGIFDNPDPKAGPFNFEAMLTPGRVSIIDLSDTDSPQVNNLVIAQLLRGIHEQQDRNYRKAAQRDELPTPVMVFIEEAHEFLSAQRIRQMPVLFQQVARIARRGRKRWLGLAFVTQLPQHLPDEVLGLINNWVVHKISDANMVSRLRRSIGGVDEGLWDALPSLAPGQAIVSFTSLARPLLVAIDPSPCRLRMVG
jgi:DNA helicase HerA-like ATPase